MNSRALVTCRALVNSRALEGPKLARTTPCGPHTFASNPKTSRRSTENVHLLTEGEIGLLMALNGFLIFLIEMPLIKYFDRPQFSIYRLLFISTLLFAFSFYVLSIHFMIH